MKSPAVNPVITYPTVEVIAAAIIAFRECNNTIQQSDECGDSTTPRLLSNKSRVLELLRQNAVFSEEVREEATAMISALQANMTLNLLTGKRMSDFVKDLISTLNEENIPQNRVGLALYAPKVHAGLVEKSAVTEQVNECLYTSAPLGEPGQKVSLTFKLIEKRFVMKINCFSAFGSDEQGNLVSFLTSDEDRCQSGKITGKVKSAGIDKFHNNATVTSLNYVKTVQ